MGKQSAIRTIYLYIFSLLGLVLLIIGGVRIVNMGLRALIFTQADEQRRIDYMRPPTIYQMEKLEEIGLEESEQFTEKEKIQIQSIIQSHEAWQERSSAIDPLTGERHRDASISLAMMLIGLPLYIYHWKMTKKESKA